MSKILLVEDNEMNRDMLCRRLNGGVEQILSKHAFPPPELMVRLGALLAETRKAQK